MLTKEFDFIPSVMTSCTTTGLFLKCLRWSLLSTFIYLSWPTSKVVRSDSPFVCLSFVCSYLKLQSYCLFIICLQLPWITNLSGGFLDFNTLMLFCLSCVAILADMWQNIDMTTPLVEQTNYCPSAWLTLLKSRVVVVVFYNWKLCPIYLSGHTSEYVLSVTHNSCDIADFSR